MALASVSLQAGAGEAASSVPTFNREVEPILQRHCTSCHRSGESAPFPLVTYQDARRRARLIEAVTRDRLMPPWRPDPGHGEFAGARRLSSEEIETLARWVRAGAPQGEGPEPREVTHPPGDALPAPPDMVLRLPEPYILSSSGADQIRTFVVPTHFGERRQVRALVFEPAGTAAIHHANIKVDSTHSSRWLDEEDSEVGYEGAGGRGALFPEGHFLGWTVGQSPRSTENVPWTLEPGADVVLELHLTPTGKAESVQPVLKLYFTDRPAGLPPYMIRIGRQDLDIPAGVSAHHVVDHYTLPVDVRVLAVQPHAHSLARELRGYATLPDRSVTPLIRISRWDPRWQDVYRYIVPVALPRGTTLTIEYFFDNSEQNPRNPHSPPQRVIFGQDAAAEMGDLWLQVMTATADERHALDRDFAPKMLSEDIAGAVKVLEARPSDPRAQTDLALCYTAAGRWDEALVHLQAAARLAPGSAGAHFELGVALLRARRFEDARTHLLEARRLKPDLAEAYANLGAASHASGNVRDAVGWYERALELNPRDADTEYNLGRAHAAMGSLESAIRHYEASLALAPADPLTMTSLASALALSKQTGAAVKYYRRALELNPELVPALVDLAWILATDDSGIGNPREAVGFARRAKETTQGSSAVVLDTLAVAHAALGEYVEAVDMARQALGLARAAADTTLAERISLRLEFYETQALR